MKTIIYGQPIGEEPQDDPDVIVVAGCCTIVDDDLIPNVPLQPHWVGGYVRGCADMTPEQRQNIIDQLTSQAIDQVAELLA